jgi:hypothetical protein
VRARCWWWKLIQRRGSGWPRLTPDSGFAVKRPPATREILHLLRNSSDRLLHTPKPDPALAAMATRRLECRSVMWLDWYGCGPETVKDFLVAKGSGRIGDPGDGEAGSHRRALLHRPARDLGMDRRDGIASPIQRRDERPPDGPGGRLLLGRPVTRRGSRAPGARPAPARPWPRASRGGSQGSRGSRGRCPLPPCRTQPTARSSRPSTIRRRSA